MALQIGQYGDVLRMLISRRPQGVIFQLLKDFGRGRPQDNGRERPLAFHRGPYRGVHKTSFGDVLRTSSGRNIDEWVIKCFLYTLGLHFNRFLKDFNENVG